MPKWFIMARRSQQSVLGAAARPLRHGDEGTLYFPTRAEAQAEADRLNKNTVSPNVHYTVEEEH